MSERLQFWYDFSCPYAYLASTRVEALAAATGASLEVCPMLLGGVFRAVDTPDNLAATMPAVKARHTLRDTHRFAAHWDVPLRYPAGHPIRTVTALRCVLAVGEPLLPLSHAFFRAYWVDGVDLSTDEGVASVLTAQGHDAATVLERARTQAIKDELRARTDRAIGLGIFGAPAFVVDGALYWGQDRMGQVVAALGSPEWRPVAAPEGAGRQPIDFWFDYSSPYAAIAAAQVDEVLGANVRYRPMLLGAVFAAVGTTNVPLHAFSQAKQRWAHADMTRQAAAAGLPLRWPSRFPMRTLLPLRATLVAGADTPGGRRLVHGLFRAYWCDDRDISHPEVVAAVADAAGLDGLALVAAAGEPPAKAALREATEAAVAAGVFGAPTFVVDPGAGADGRYPLFWGADRLDLVARAAAGDAALVAA